ncbi:MAG TPA: DUF4232 domain-containing protein, partial [Streptosporangiaceae bacterium]
MNRFSRVAARVLAGAALAALAALTIASAATGGVAQASGSTPRCTTAGLQVWLGLGAGGAAAGSVSYPMEFTNITSHTCYLYGHPGVSAVRAGHQAGSAASRVRSPFGAERVVTLAPGATAHTVLRITDAGNFPASACGPVTADALRVYPPDAFRSALIPFTFRACSKKGPVYLFVQYV